MNKFFSSSLEMVRGARDIQILFDVVGEIVVQGDEGSCSNPPL